MNIENAWFWHKALKSDKYKQGRDVLRNSDDKFCCLGVLCDVAINNGVKVEWLINPGQNAKIKSLKYATCPQIDSTAPIDEVYEWLGIKPSSHTIIHNLSMINFMGMNDKDGFDFDQIADELEKEIKGYEAMA